MYLVAMCQRELQERYSLNGPLSPASLGTQTASMPGVDHKVKAELLKLNMH